MVRWGPQEGRHMKASRWVVSSMVFFLSKVRNEGSSTTWFSWIFRGIRNSPIGFFKIDSGFNILVRCLLRLGTLRIKQLRLCPIQKLIISERNVLFFFECFYFQEVWHVQVLQKLEDANGTPWHSQGYQMVVPYFVLTLPYDLEIWEGKIVKPTTKDCERWHPYRERVGEIAERFWMPLERWFLIFDCFHCDNDISDVDSM